MYEVQTKPNILTQSALKRIIGSPGFSAEAGGGGGGGAGGRGREGDWH